MHERYSLVVNFPILLTEWTYRGMCNMQFTYQYVDWLRLLEKKKWIKELVCRHSDANKCCLWRSKQDIRLRHLLDTQRNNFNLTVKWTHQFPRLPVITHNTKTSTKFDKRNEAILLR